MFSASAYRMHGVTVRSSPTTAFYTIHGYRSKDYLSINETILVAETDDGEPVQAKYVDVFNNVSAYGLSIPEFEVYGTGIFIIYYPSTSCRLGKSTIHGHKSYYMNIPCACLFLST